MNQDANFKRAVTIYSGFISDGFIKDNDDLNVLTTYLESIKNDVHLRSKFWLTIKPNYLNDSTCRDTMSELERLRGFQSARAS